MEAAKNSDSEIDFNDVFGGPPWTRYSYRGSRIKPWEDSPTGSVERLVFGESRRRTSDESVRSRRWCSPGLRLLTPDKIESSAALVHADLSSPANMTKSVDVHVTGSYLHTPNTNLSRFSSPATQIFRNKSGQSRGQTLFSHASSSVNDSLHSTRSLEKDIDKNLKPETGSARNKFHFSMHKWANVEIPLLMCTLKGCSNVSALSSNSMQKFGVQNEDLSAEKQDTNPVSGFSLMEVIPASSLLRDEIERKGYEEAITEAGTEETMERASVKRKLEEKKMNSSNKAEANKRGFRSPKNRVKGMVKDFFRISNQESPKTKTNVSSGLKNRSRRRIQEEVDDIISNLDTNVEIMTDALKTTKLASDVSAESVKMAPNATITTPFDVKVPADDANEETKTSNKQKFTQNRTIRKLEDINFQNDSDSVANRACVETIDELSLDNFQVEELGSVMNKLTKTQELETIMALDSKIQMWSSGRTGNIRSLLSTLQLVLWADSGWKPVALVDILEANAVKKAYNRAMLCLHPDKLQQKGVDAHKKYIAEKVFDILQEAWDHLNSLDGFNTLVIM
ncbi:hypothetical protein QVD17_25210 [Tagetes erecta]|uniref:J domain-containing protein required for chloroplast accumulation response 1 n=1 Tax=Tagetes erecta TaxID=13708 RepID=A0AAD8KG33_TARER|nr:hypothetical protein QVD17_25210 [Tagetes erecta]